MVARIGMMRALYRHKPKPTPVPRRKRRQSLQDRPMTTLAKLLARKQQLLERLQEDPGQHERDEIGRQLQEIDMALNLLDEAGPGTSSDEQ
jgi:hypothetical protein